MEKIELMCGRILAWTGRGSESKRGGSLTERGGLNTAFTVNSKTSQTPFTRCR